MFWYFCRDCFSKKHKRWSVAKDLCKKSSISLFCWFHADGKRDSFPARKNEKILKLDQAKRDDVGFFGQDGLFKSLLTLSLLVYLDFFLTTWYSKICQMEAILKKLHFPYRSILNHYGLCQSKSIFGQQSRTIGAKSFAITFIP